MRRAFSLIEILVVVSIIALLIAILLPVLSQARYSAKVAQCQVAVRSIASVQLSYAVDNDGYFPLADRTEYSGTGSWFQAGKAGAQVRSWEIYAPGKYDLRPIYYDYMQNNTQDAILHCPFLHQKGKHYNENRDDRILTYMLYVTKNYRTKHFYFEEVGGYQRLGDTWSPEGEHDAEFTLLASDFAFGNYAPHGVKDENGDPYKGALVAHPAPNGSIYEQFAELNDAGGYVVNETQNSPNNFADVDGSVQTYTINANSYKDKDTWVVNDKGNNRAALLPRDLAR